MFGLPLIPSLGDSDIYGTLATLLLLLIWGWILMLLLRKLAHSRPGLALGGPLALAFGLRVCVVYALGAVSVSSQVRGADEAGFIVKAQVLSNSSLTSGEFTSAFTGKLHIWLMAVQDHLLAPPTEALRITFIGLTVIGLLLMAIAVYELAGPQAARLALVVLAIDPSTLFFASVLHKEPLMYFAEGLFIFGAAVLWKRGILWALVPMMIGCAIALTVRSYAGWFLIAAGGAILLHATLRVGPASAVRGLALLAATAIVAAIAVPVFVEKSSGKELKRLQRSQTANAKDKEAKLSLDEVDFSNRGAIIANLPVRLRDVLLRPYPWQLSNWSQRFGFLGTVVVELTLVLLIYFLWRVGGGIMSRAGPFVYTTAFLLVAYSLSAGNAGTAYRYRTHLVALAICMVVTLRAYVRERATDSGRAAMEQEPRRLNVVGATP